MVLVSTEKASGTVTIYVLLPHTRSKTKYEINFPLQYYFIVLQIIHMFVAAVLFSIKFYLRNESVSVGSVKKI